MAGIIIYTTATCPYCEKAKALLRKKSLEFTEIPVDDDGNLRRQLIEMTGRATVPQIYFGALHIGGCDDLYELHYDGKLDQLLTEHAQ